VRLSLQGQTAFLRENAWSQRLGIGRGILRPLLSELAGLGFVLHVPRRGWQVRPFSEQDMLQYLEIRELLELKALELAQGHLDSQRLQEMLEGNPTAPGDAVETDPWAGQGPPLDPSGTDHARASLPPLNNEIHGYLIQQAGNRYIADFFQRHSAYYTQLFQMAAVQTGWRDAMAAQHREILLALLEHDWSRAQVALANHIRAQRPVVQELLKQIRAADNLGVSQQA
jgi:DNA-binding GntR family transcriptional regulator